MKKEVFLFKVFHCLSGVLFIPDSSTHSKDTLNILDIAQIDPSELHGTEASSFLL